jgi:hypothetical protein
MKAKGVWWSGLTVTVSAALGIWGVNQAEVPWNLSSIHLPPASGVTFAAAYPVTVSILDTGMSAQPLLDGVQRAGHDFVPRPRTAGDGTGRDPAPLASRGGTGDHGTAAVAGVVHSVNPQARLVHVRVIGRANKTTLADAWDGLRWAAGLDVPGAPRNPFPARVINASFSLNTVPHTGCAPAMQRAVDEVIARATGTARRPATPRRGAGVSSRWPRPMTGDGAASLPTGGRWWPWRHRAARSRRESTRCAREAVRLNSPAPASPRPWLLGRPACCLPSGPPSAQPPWPASWSAARSRAGSRGLAWSHRLGDPAAAQAPGAAPGGDKPVATVPHPWTASRCGYGVVQAGRAMPSLWRATSGASRSAANLTAG